ncbi:MAG: exo-beta-N-acetylmuramidase NamZ domain-containing protein [Prevotella sp.]
MKRIAILLGCLCLIVAGSRAQKIKTGIEVLKSEDFKSLEGLRIGLVTNPTGVDNNLVSDIDLLHRAANVKLVALFGPEHGVRGSSHAGDAVDNDSDATTGLPVFSLYGKNRIPSDEMLQGIDALVYDIQDVGCRSFTYISTLYNVMKAAVRNHKKVVVLDRPNPLGGEKIEGNMTEDNCISFVSQFKIPYVYGLTPGELALYLNGEGLIPGGRCDLQVIKMKGWKRRMTYEDTGLHWVLSSPHIPEASTAPFYSVTGIIGELYNISIGVGYTLPFKLIGAEWIKAPEFAERMNNLKLPGVIFRPVYYTPYYSVGKGKELQGVQVYFTDYRKASLCDVQWYALQELYKLYPDHDPLKEATDRHNMFDKVCGSFEVRRLFMKRHMWEDAKPYWDKDVASFRKIAKKYHLYK